LPSAKLQGHHNQAAGRISLEKGLGWGDLLLRRDVKSRTSPQIVEIKDPPVLKTDTQETESVVKAISFDQKGESMYLLQLRRHMSTK
jgi:hypothetical protein